MKFGWIWCKIVQTLVLIPFGNHVHVVATALAIWMLVFMYTIRSEDNWKLFSPKSDLPYPSHRTHPSFVFGSRQGGRTMKYQKIAIWRAFLPKTNFFLTPPVHTHPVYPPGPPCARLFRSYTHFFCSPVSPRVCPWIPHPIERLILFASS
jgi:hypothetical protein